LSTNSKRFDTFLWTTPAPSIYQIGLKTQNHGAQFYIGCNVKYSFNAPIFKKINIAEQHYVEMLPAYIELHPNLSQSVEIAGRNSFQPLGIV
jgi:hypothetical protein